jgi:beta-glucosidase
VYAGLPQGSGEPPKRLVGWNKVLLKAGESRELNITVDPRYLSVYDEATNTWKLLPGEYTVSVGGSSQSLPLQQKIVMK